jgi:F-box/WD-40 domain protein 7
MKKNNNIRKKKSIDYFNCLPAEIGEKVLSHLNPTDLIRASQVNQRFQQLCQNSMIWKKKCQEAGIKGFS